MKSIKPVIFLFLIFALFSCKNKPEPNLQLFSPDAFAFDVGGSWEVNATINAKGFEQIERKDSFGFKLFYSVNLITPEHDTLNNIFTDTLASNQKNEFIDIPIDVQIELDTNFSVGTYKLMFNVIDKFSKQKKSAEVNFSLTND